MDALIAYLKDGGPPEDPARKELATLLTSHPEQAAAVFLRAAVATVEAAPDAASRTRQFLGYVERLFGYLLDDPQVGWQSIFQIFPKFVEGLPGSFRMTFPSNPSEMETSRHYQPAFQSLSMDFKARASAGSIRTGDMADRALATWVISLVGNADEKKSILEMIRKELGTPTPAMVARLDEIAVRPVIRRERVSSASFVLKIPTQQSRAVAPAALIEPDESLRFKLKAAVGPEGFTIVEAANGADALGVIEAAKPKVVIMELVLSGVTGLAVLAKLKSMVPPIPVVLKSSDDRLAADFEVKTYPAIVVLKKPVTPEAVVDAVRALRAKFNF